MEGNGARRGAAIGEQEARVVRGGIGVDGDLVEADPDRLRKGLMQVICGHGRIGGDDADHGGHIGHDHA